MGSYCNVMLYFTAVNNYKPTYQFPDDDDKSDTKSVNGKCSKFSFVVQI